MARETCCCARVGVHGIIETLKESKKVCEACNVTANYTGTGGFKPILGHAWAAVSPGIPWVLLSHTTNVRETLHPNTTSLTCQIWDRREWRVDGWTGSAANPT